VRDEDFDRQRTQDDIASGADVEQRRVPGKQTLVESESQPGRGAPSGPGKRTNVETAFASQHASSSTRDPVTETEFHIRAAREIIAKLAANSSGPQLRLLKADLRHHLHSAQAIAALAVSRPDGHDAVAAMFQLIAEAQPHLRSTTSSEPPGGHADANDPVSIAQRGITGPGERLPHFDLIQRSFGAHDLSGVRAHIGGAAAGASRELGAHAYAHGNDIAFAEQPTPELVAHEATHVVQQRAGVSLKSVDGGADDAHEQQADAVASAVARGESAEPILDAIPRGAGTSAAVQRKSGAGAAQTARDDGPPTTKTPHSKWPVFSDNGLPYKIVSATDPVQFWTISDWIRAGAGFKASGNRATSPACAAEIFGALGWVPKDRIEFAAQHVTFDISRRVAESQVAPSAFYYLGMPTSRPVVSRTARDIVQVATRLDDPSVPAGTRIEPDDAQRLQVIRALADFTGLAPAPDALDNLRNDPRFHDAVVQSGVILWNIDSEAGNNVFGFDTTSDNAGPYTRWLHGKQDKKKQPDSDEPDKPKFKLHNYYGEPIPGALVADRELVEAGHPIWLEVTVKWPKDYPSASDYAVVPIVTPGHLNGEVALLKCEWHVELLGGGAATAASANTPSASAPATPNTAQPAATASSTPANAGAPSTAPSATKGSSTSAASSGAVANTSVAELHHAFVLPPGQAKGTFRVTVHASFDEYFEPAEFTKTIEVSSTAAAMKQLGDDAFADLGARETSRAAESFDASGSGDDNHGYRTTGELPASFKPSTLDGPDPGAASRDAERKRLEATKMYLQANGAQADVLGAVDREIEASRDTEAALASDRSKGWQPFQIRGTYLAREDGIPSGALTLYGSVHSDTAPGLKAHGVQQTPDRGEVVVQIRDLSRRFDNQDMTFTGRGDSFDAALKDAFTDNAKAYPKGVMAIEAEAIEARVDGSQATIGKGNGKTVGFEIGTDSRWKRVKAEVWSPVVNIATNLGAMALMAFVPGSAVVVAPLLIAYNSAPAIDRIRTESERGTLTLGEAATSVGEIALNLLPLVGRAKAFSKGWFLLEGANWGGQAVLMTASAIQTARALQSQDVEALAGMYEELQKLESSGADPAAVEQKRQQVMKRAKAVSDRIEEALGDQIATNAMFAVAGTVIHNTGTEFQRGSLIDSYLGARGAPGGEPATTGAASGTNTGTGEPTAAPIGGHDEQHRASATDSAAGARDNTPHSDAKPPSAQHERTETHSNETDAAATNAQGQNPDDRTAAPPAATKEGLVETLAKNKALAEQHAHADGSVPIDSVLVESRDITVEDRAQQIDDLRKILDEVTKEVAKAKADGKAGKDPEISDLRPGHRTETDGTVTPQKKLKLVSVEAALAQEKGLVNRLYEAKVALQRELQKPRPNQRRVRTLTQNVQIALRRYREHLVMRKPDYARYAADVQTGAEFFRRYKMITGHNLSPREIADTRASAGQLAAQELRVGIGGDSMKDTAALKEIAKDFNQANDEARTQGDPTDVSLIVNTTKKKSGTAAHAEEMAGLVDTWAGDQELQRAVSGLDNAGVESAELPPSKLWKMSAKRAFMNAERVKAELGRSVSATQRTAFIESLGRVVGGENTKAAATLERFESFDFSAAMSAVDARPAGETIAVTADGVVTETFGGMTMEEAATVSRQIMDALRARRAETGDTTELPRLLGYTVHAGEQLKDVDPFELLKQVEESINLGADRIGHGLILTIDAQQLVKMKRLPEARVNEFVARQQQVRDHAKQAHVTIEMNITSNTEISNLAADQHPTTAMVKSGLRVSVSTDDETTLGTTVKDELRRLAAAPGTSRTDVAVVILEGFYSRMGARPLGDRARLRTEYFTTLTQGLNATELDSMAQTLSDRFHTAPVEGDPRATINRALAAVFGTGG
jgi:hypothetical protein